MTSANEPTCVFRPNVETVKQVYDAFRRRDLAAALALCAPDVVIDQSGEVPWGGHYEGHEGARTFHARLARLIDSTLAPESFIDAGDSVVAIGRTRGTVRLDGARYDVPIAHVWTLRGGLVVRAQYFIDNPTMLVALTPSSA